MNIKNKILLGLVLVFIGIQFYRPNKTEKQAITLDDLLLYNKAPEDISLSLKTACYDCHSDQPQSYWYSNIAPITWLIDNDIKKGKKALNFSDWGQYSQEKRIERAGEIMHQLFENKMPLDKYLFMHPEAVLTKAEKNSITKWINSTL